MPPRPKNKTPITESSPIDPTPIHSAMLAVASQPPPPAATYTDVSRPTLPPLSQLQSHHAPAPPSSSFSSHGQPNAPSANPVSPLGSSNPHHPLPSGRHYMPMRLGSDDYYKSTPTTDPEYSPSNRSRSYNPLKRTYESVPVLAERSGYALAQATASSESGDSRALLPRSSTTSSLSDASTPTTATSGYLPTNPMAFSPTQSDSGAATTAARCSLHVRQQPRAARAGPDGKDRRPIDPPPILQLLMNDFDANSTSDVAEIHSTFWVVHCRLVSAQSPKKDMSTLSSMSEDGSREIQRLLLGTTVASPFHCNDDPDPETRPSHPTTAERYPDPPSPTSRFLPTPSSRVEEKGKGRAESSLDSSGAFFIFADLSIRKAGEYRLEFNLMKVDANSLNSGSTLPIIHSVTSEIFRVVNAKDFDQVQPSTNLVKGLLDRGAGFPLKLKKGTREGQRRRGPGGRSEGGDDSDDDDDDDDL